MWFGTSVYGYTTFRVRVRVGATGRFEVRLCDLEIQQITKLAGMTLSGRQNVKVQ